MGMRRQTNLPSSPMPLGMDSPAVITPLAKVPLLTAAQERFLLIYQRTLAVDPANVHAETLIAAFLDVELPGESAEERLFTILALTSSDGGGGDGMPTTHFEWRVIAKIGTASPLGVGDLGFRRELRDSIQYVSGLDGAERPLHRDSSNQIGHFLTGVHIGYYEASISRGAARISRSRQEVSRPGPVPLGGALAPIGQVKVLPILAKLAHNIVHAVADRIAIGHELFPPTESTQQNAVDNALKSYMSATTDDISALESGNFAEIDLDEQLDGASYQDLFLTWIALLFGRRVAQHAFSSRADAARWLRLMLTDEDLGVETGRPWQGDVVNMRKMLAKFQRFQRQRAGIP